MVVFCGTSWLDLWVTRKNRSVFCPLISFWRSACDRNITSSSKAWTTLLIYCAHIFIPSRNELAISTPFHTIFIYLFIFFLVQRVHFVYSLMGLSSLKSNAFILLSVVNRNIKRLEYWLFSFNTHTCLQTHSFSFQMLEWIITFTYPTFSAHPSHSNATLPEPHLTLMQEKSWCFKARWSSDSCQVQTESLLIDQVLQEGPHLVLLRYKISYSGG